MTYNLYISNFSGTYNILNISKEQLEKAISAYLSGAESLTLSGKRYVFERIDEFRVFTFEPKGNPDEELKYYKNNVNFRVKNMFESYLPPRTLALIGKEITNEIIGDTGYGEKTSSFNEKASPIKLDFVNKSRIKELKSIKSDRFDLIRLIKLCDEINQNYHYGNYMTVAIIGRTIIDHIPPIFNCNTFDNVANNYGSVEKNKSFKKTMLHLNISLRNIADKYLHQVVRCSETLPNETQVNFSQDLDVLLDEIVRILKK